MKHAFLATVLFITSAACFAQKRNTYYLKNDGRYVATRDSADFVRIVQEPDSGSTLYNVSDLYKNGVQKLLGKSSKVLPLAFEGQVAAFYPNGKKLFVANYHSNHLTGLFYQFYPNGKIFCVLRYPEWKAGAEENYSIISCLDTVGRILVTDGNGHFKGFNDGSDGIIEEGEVKNGLREGDWKGTFAQIAIKFNENYEQGKLISGTATDKAGNTYTYTQRHTLPYYRDGKKALAKFLINQVNFFGKDDIRNVKGTPVISFFIDEKSRITGIKVTNSADETINTYLSQATAASAKHWVPATLFGIPRKEYYSFPYSLQTEDSSVFF